MNFDLVAWAMPYLLIFARLSATFFIAPGFSDTHLPVRYRLLFALALSFALKEIVPLPVASFEGVQLLSIMVQETLVGSIIGFIARLLMSILDVIGNIISMQIGLGNALAFNPNMAAQVPLVGHFVLMSGVMLFFAADFHHFVIKSFVNSYVSFPISLQSPLFSHLLPSLESLPAYFSKSFTIACQLSLPFLILGVLFQFMLGLLSRVVPSVQVFFITLPLQILLGIFLMGVILTTILSLSLQHFGAMYEHFLFSKTGP